MVRLATTTLERLLYALPAVADFLDLLDGNRRLAGLLRVCVRELRPRMISLSDFAVQNRTEASERTRWVGTRVRPRRW